MKIKILRADTLFSRWIRSRDKWTCQRCHKKYEEGSQGLHCSHYWSRGNWNTRFDPQNCDALCFGCHHLWGGDYRSDYTAFKKKQLGSKGYHDLEIRKELISPLKRDHILSLLYVRELIKQYE